MNNNSIFSRLVIRFFGCLIFLIISHPLFAQDFFPCGVFNFDVRGPEYAFSSQEFQRIRDVNANWVSSVSLTAQGGMIDSFSTLSGEIKKMTLERDTLAIVFGHYYPVNPGGPEPIRDLTNTLLWRYICDNDDVADIDSAHVDSFVTHIDSLYNGCSGLGAIMVAHQGRTDQQDRWPFIRHACTLIQNNFGDDVKSVAVHNVYYWTGGTSGLEAFFRYVDSLDVYQHEYYPFYATDPAVAPYIGDAFQNLIDERYIAYCESTRLALKRSDNTHTRLEMHIQTHEARSGTTYFRRPTQAEIWLQAFLALSRNFKGVFSYVYRSHHWPTTDYETGLIDSLTRLPINYPTYNQPYNNVAQLFAHLTELGDDILPRKVQDVYTWNGTTRHKYIKRIDGDSLEENHRTIEVAIFDQIANGETLDYFLLVNRRCNRNSAGVWVNAFPQNIDVTLADSMAAGTYQIRDLYSNEHYVTSDKIFRQIKILAGRGRIFELKRLFVNATDILSYPIRYSKYL